MNPNAYEGAQQAGYAGDASVKPTTLGALLMAVKLLSEAAMSSRTVTDKLCGGSPESGSASKLSALPNGTFAEIEHAAETIEGYARQIIGDTHRIENRL